jgi:hypothetical protein
MIMKKENSHKDTKTRKRDFFSIKNPLCLRAFVAKKVMSKPKEETWKHY